MTEDVPRPRWRLPLLVLLGYAAVGALRAAPLLSHPLHGTLGGGRGDVALFLWFVSHTSTALVHDHGHGLLVTYALNAPHGVNLMWNTSLLLPGALLAPVTATAGPVLSLNLIIVLGPVLSAWSAYLCSGRFLTRTPARVVVGLVFGFSPALMAASVGHFHLTLLMLVPPLLLLTVDAVTGHRGPVRSGLLLGLVVACQILVGEEVLALSGVAVVVLVALLAVQRRQQVRARVLPVLRAAGIAGAVTVLLAGYPLYVQFFGPQHVRGEVQSLDTIVLDPAQLVVPAPEVALQHNLFERVLHVTPLNGSESMGYVGAPLLVLLAVVLWVRRRDLVARTAGLAAAVLAVLALGYTLHLAGHRTGIPVPWKLSSGLPVIGNVLPVRWMLLVDLFVALLVGVAVELVPRAGRRRPVAAALLVLCLVPLAPRLSGPSQPTRTPAYFAGEGSSLRDTVLLLPVPTASDVVAMKWHAEAGTRFPIPGGYFIGPRRDGRAGFGTCPRRPTEQVLLQLAFSGTPVQLTPTLRRHARDDLAYWGARTVVLGPAPYEPVLLDFVTTLLHRAPERTGGVWVWRGVDPSQV